MIASTSFAILLAAFHSCAADLEAEATGLVQPAAAPIANFLNNIGGQAQIVGPAVSRLRATHERAIDLREDYLHLIENLGSLPRTFIDNLIPENASPAVGPDGRVVMSVPQVMSAVFGPVRILSDLLSLPQQLILRPVNTLLEMERNLLGQTEIVEPILEGASAAVAQHRQARLQHRASSPVVPAQVPIYGSTAPATPRRAESIATGSLRQGHSTDSEESRPTPTTLTEEVRAELKKKIYEAWSKSLVETLTGKNGEALNRMAPLSSGSRNEAKNDLAPASGGDNQTEAH
eukprot:Gregarina_sp_Poly_1__3046@NODE_1857_length_3192_cov_78_086400_g199_i2_p1_GENE_NODE_1857_length_3192_cov_78_086400_g199_i2NODE_1857_length_3192_cov_78_086400_g199_i2_p1_ORF_typecomplete_len290_score43_04_NODE_1857_length_3192_cov_78_086400_g199_i214752344